MSRVFAYLIRFAVILIGYAAAALAASAFLHLVFVGQAGLSTDEASFLLWGSLFFSIPFTALFVGYFAFTPAAIAILAGELLDRRDWLFHAMAGAAVGVAVLALFWQGMLPSADHGIAGDAMSVDAAFQGSRFIASVMGAGIVGGIAYWFCAGRFAGSWRDTPDASISSGPSGS